jgi:hypothetical protein
MPYSVFAANAAFEMLAYTANTASLKKTNNAALVECLAIKCFAALFSVFAVVV